jgi:hypothetical protein
MKRTSVKTKTEAAEALLSQDRPEDIEQGEIVRGGLLQASPTSVRLSAPLLEAIDRLAASEHRKRGNMIQHILWEYVRSHGGEFSGNT